MSSNFDLAEWNYVETSDTIVVMWINQMVGATP